MHDAALHAGAATILTQGERFRGVALWFFDVGELVPGFEAMNIAQ